MHHSLSQSFPGTGGEAPEPLWVDNSERWLKALWIGWSICCLAILGFWWSALSASLDSQLNQKRLALQSISEELSQDFLALEQLPQVLLSELRQATLSDSLSLAQLRVWQEQGSPFCQLYWVDRQGRPVHSPELFAPAPTWLLTLANSRVPRDFQDMRVLRPLPPGTEAGRLSPEQLVEEPGTPEEFLVFAVVDPENNLLLAEMNLEEIFGSWLHRRLERVAPDFALTTFHPATDLDGGKLSNQSLPALSDQPLTAGTWTWTCPTFLTQDRFPFPPVVLTTNNKPVMRQTQNTYGTALGIVVVLMGGLGLCLLLGARAWRREKELAMARTRFTDMVSHELRTPISAITMYAEILRTGLFDKAEQAERYYDIIERESKRLGRMVEDILAFGQLERRQRTLTPTPIDLEEFLTQLQQRLGPSGARLQVKKDPNLKSLVCDPEALTQILTNLVDNACKFSEEHLAVELVLSETQGRVSIGVLDRGPGIPEPWRKRVFEPYGKGPSQQHGKRPGIGLGLAVVQELVKALGGEISCRDRQGGGTEFALHLPKKGSHDGQDSAD